jgi:enolase
MANPTISSVHARQILDSRGRPTVEVDVLLSDGSQGRAAVPSGASTGAAEAHELRDGDANYYEGRGVLNAVAHVNGEISQALAGKPAFEQNAIDALLLDLDGSAQLKRLGANAILGCSLAVCRASAVSARQPLYQRIAELAGITTLSMPMPMVNILSGGLHAGRGMDVQDFLAIPASATSIEEAIHNVARMRSAATRVMERRGLTTLLADEGGLSPGLKTGREALELMVAAAEEADLEPGKDMVIAIDVAASSLKGPNGSYRFAKEGRDLHSDQVIEMLDGWVRDFPIASIEDGLDEEDWQGWTKLTALLGNQVRLIGDDLFSTNLARVQRGISSSVANGVLVKVNQNGTLSGTLEVIALARRNGYAPVVSARSGETEDDFIADLAVGTAAGQIKIGSVRCSDRLSKYNQLLRIEEQSRAAFAGMSAIRIGG